MKLFLHYLRAVLFCVSVAAIIVSGSYASDSASQQNEVKYVFYFIGDGMATIQIRAAEAYLASLAEGYNDSKVGTKLTENLKFSNLPAYGMATTYAADRFITDSAAAGTALACGEKTACGVVSLSTNRQKRLTTIAELAKNKGMKVGIVTSVSIDHATPAVFYAHQISRDNYYDIGLQLANSNFDYYAGGALKQPKPRQIRGRRGAPADANAVTKDSYEIAVDNGFRIVTSKEELSNCKPGERIIAYNKAEESMQELHYEIDRPDNCMSLAEFTENGIRLLDNDKGFFLMVEGGKIDWACHANDAMTSISDTIALDKAVEVALKFYEKHPDKTLIVVAADHETGGMTMGFATTQYSTAFEVLKNQKMSYEYFDDNVWSKYSSDTWNGVKDNIPDNLKTDINDCFGLVYDKLNPFEKKLLEDAYDKSMAKEKKIKLVVSGFQQQDELWYGTYNPISVSLTHMLNNKAGIAWTSYAHTGAPIEVHVIGIGCESFNGFYDNTDIPRKMASIMGIELKN
ncbi:MAG: alkaline phosphatase [Sedimentisphaerales bacterium]|nr:alkaline phosphatase [Sedimentisphaerales bacterium]